MNYIGKRYTTVNGSVSICLRNLVPDFGPGSRAMVPASIPSHRINCDLCELFPLLNFTYTFYQVCNRNNAFKSKLYFISG